MRIRASDLYARKPTALRKKAHGRLVIFEMTRSRLRDRQAVRVDRDDLRLADGRRAVLVGSRWENRERGA